MKRYRILTTLMGALLGAALIGGAQQSSRAAAADAAENSQSILNSAVSPSLVTLRGNVSIQALAASAANRQALAANHPEIEQPLHRLPNGKLTSQPGRAVTSAPAANTSIAAQFTSNSTISSISGFTGVNAGDNATANGYELEPPDQGLAVNSNVAAEIVNNTLRFFNATNGVPLTAPIATSTLFNLDPAVYNLSDPQVFFDSVSQRWFFTEVVYNNTVNSFAIAVSQSSNPLGAYYVYLADAFSSQVSGCGSVDCFPDYPKDGYNADAFFITADLFSNVSGNYVEAAIFALPKASLEAGKSFNYVRFDDPNDFVLQPSVPAPGEPFSTAHNGSEFLLSAPTAIFLTGPPSVSVLAVVNTKSIVSNPSALQALLISVRSQSYGVGTIPSSEPNVVGPYCASVGVTSAPRLDGGYSAFQSTIQKAGGNLYGALASGTKDGNGLYRDIINYFEIAPTLTSTSLTASIVHQGQIIPPNGYSISYPAFGLLKSGAGVIGFTITNPNPTLAGGFPSAAVMQFDGTAPTGGIVISGKGYTSDDGFTGCGAPGPGTVGRWGDYGAAVVDAATGHLYTGSEMIPNPNVYPRGTYSNWGTYITQIY